MFWNRDNPFLYAIEGTDNEYLQEAMKIFCEQNNISNIYQFDSIRSIYAIIYFIDLDNIEWHQTIQFGHDQVEGAEFQIVSIREFISRYYSKGEEPWYNSLQVGDKVTIADVNDDDPEKYPLEFIEEMQDLHGQVFTIKQIGETPNLDNCMLRECFNGDIREYFLAESSATHYFWHSSMFESIETKKIPKLILTETNIQF